MTDATPAVGASLVRGAGVCAAAMAVMLAAACNRGAPAPAADAAGGVPAGSVRLDERSRPFVRVEPARTAPVTTSRVMPGHAAYSDRGLAEISAPIAARVASVSVRLGQAVRVDQELARFISPDIVAAEADVAAARQARLLAETTAARATLLASQGAGADADRENADAALAAARIEEARATAALAAVGGGDSRAGVYVLRSPISGTVTDIAAHVGATVSPDSDDALFTVADLRRIWILAEVRPGDRPFVTRGTPAAIELATIPGRVFRGTVSYVGDTVDASTQSSQARIELDNATATIRPGMFAQITLTAPARGIALIPKTAVVGDRDRFFVYVPGADGVFARRAVTLGDEHGDDVAVASGLKPGDIVVVRGALLLDVEANRLL